MKQMRVKIVAVRGIPIYAHVSFLIVLPFLAFLFGQRFRSAADLAEVPPEALTGSPFLWGALVAVALFASVLVHELAHSLYALREGGRVRDITLLMIGGVSHIAEPPRGHAREAVMALVGPLASFALAGVFHAAQLSLRGTASFNLQFAFFYLAALNLLLGLFNLLPAFPLDGGRIVRALLAMRIGDARATRVASLLGKAFAVLFAVWALAGGGIFLLLIAFFVWMGAEAEDRMARMSHVLRGGRVADAMAAPAGTVEADEPAFQAGERMLSLQRTVLPVVDGTGRIAGVLSLEAIQRVPPERRMTVPVFDVMVATPTLRPDEDLDRAMKLLAEHGVEQLPVADRADGRLLGMVGQDDIMRQIRIRELEASQAAWGARRRRMA